MSAVVKATRKPFAFTKRETVGQRAQRMFRAHAASLPRPKAPTWADASPAVREFWMDCAKAAEHEPA